eukprot:765405-Amphidinium_carterae.1
MFACSTGPTWVAHSLRLPTRDGRTTCSIAQLGTPFATNLNPHTHQEAHSWGATKSRGGHAQLQL